MNFTAFLSQVQDKAPEYDLRDLMAAGLHFGHQKTKWNPKMKKWIYMEKDGVHIFDLAKTAEQLRIAYNIAYTLAATGKQLLIVGTKKQAREIVETEAKAAGMPYIVSRWLGGMLTNWDQIRKSIKRMNDIFEGLESGAFKSYTKYERTQLEKEAQRMERFLGGIKGMGSKPDMIFIVDSTRERNAIAEAKSLDVPIMGLADSNSDPYDFDVVVPGNDDAPKCIQLVVNAVASGYAAGKKAAKK